ncbi:MAG: phosphatase PAP2 family protein, partial [Gemmatimonadales bacterium]
VQVIKRLVVRSRPSTHRPNHTLVADPDRFSFPSGHSASSFAVAAAYATSFPALAPLLIGVGMLVGWSRIALGVHYPGDVAAGQLIALLTVLALML